jgi:hypothetical protein
VPVSESAPMVDRDTDRDINTDWDRDTDVEGTRPLTLEMKKRKQISSNLAGYQSPLNQFLRGLGSQGTAFKFKL